MDSLELTSAEKSPAERIGSRPTQCDCILALLAARQGEYVSMVELWKVSGAFAVHSRVADLRRAGHCIANKIQVLEDGAKASFYALLPKAEKPAREPCPKCGRPYNPATDTVIECARCRNVGSTACCNPAGRGVICAECDADEVEF